MKFKDLMIGEKFDWIGGEYPSFFKRCEKLSAKKYKDSDGNRYFVLSINAEVYHPEGGESERAKG